MQNFALDSTLGVVGVTILLVTVIIDSTILNFA